MKPSNLALERLRSGVALVETKSATASACLLDLVDDLALLLTAYHALPDDRKETPRVRFRDTRDKELEGKDPELIWADRLSDFAILAVDLPKRSRTIHPMRRRRKTPIRVGDEVYTIGNPADLVQVVSRGVIAGLYHDGDAPQVAIDAHVHPGCSGGPLFDSRGTLIGMMTAAYREGFEGLNLALPIDYVNERIRPWMDAMDQESGERAPASYRATHELSGEDLPDVRVLRQMIDHAQVACGLDLHRDYRMVHFRREVGKEEGKERVEMVLQHRDGRDHVRVEVVGRHYKAIEHGRGVSRGLASPLGSRRPKSEAN